MQNFTILFFILVIAFITHISEAEELFSEQEYFQKAIKSKLEAEILKMKNWKLYYSVSNDIEIYYSPDSMQHLKNRAFLLHLKLVISMIMQSKSS